MRSVRVVLAFVVMASLFGIAGPSAAEVEASPELVTVGVDGRSGESLSAPEAISADGRFVTFISAASDLVPGDVGAPRVGDLFLRDRLLGDTQRIAVDAAFSSISDDGRKVAFFGDGLVPEDDNDEFDIYVFDRDSGDIELVSVTNGGDQNTGSVGQRTMITGDGRFVFFSAVGLPLDDHGPLFGTFVRDLEAGTTELVIDETLEAMSPDGRFHVFTSNAGDLVDPPFFNQDRIYNTYRLDRATGRVEFVFRSNRVDSFSPSVSADGRYVAFLRERALGRGGEAAVWIDTVTGDTQLVSVDDDGGEGRAFQRPLISDDGRFVFFVGSDNGEFGVLRFDSVTGERVLLDGVSAAVDFTPDLDTLLYGTREDVVPEDTNGTGDGYVIGLPAPTPACEGLLATIVGSGFVAGTPGDDVIVGSAGADTINAGDGNDTICGLAGPDIINGGDGNDLINPGPGDDTAIAGDGNDILVTSTGADVLRGGPGNDTADYRAAGGELFIKIDGLPNDGQAGEGDNVVPGIEILLGGIFDDILVGSNGPDVIRAGPGDDIIRGRAGNDTLGGGPGNDTIRGDTGNDTLNGGQDDDRLIGGPGTDNLTGGNGTDLCRGSAGLDTYHTCETTQP